MDQKLRLESLPILETHIEASGCGDGDGRVALEEGEDFLRVAAYDAAGRLELAIFYPFSREGAEAARHWCRAGERFSELSTKGWTRSPRGEAMVGWWDEVTV